MWKFVLGVSVGGALLLLGLQLSRPAEATSADPAVMRQLGEVRAATAKYHNVQAAVDAGYIIPTDPAECVPGMGYHAINPGLFDQNLNPLQPEVLLYAPGPGGKLRLVGVEYIYNYGTMTDPGSGATVPTLFGTSFVGPMPGHFPGMPWHSELHTWIWSSNPDGTFNETNSRVSCS